MLIVPMDIKGIRLYLGDPADFRFVAAHEEAATQIEALTLWGLRWLTAPPA